MDETSLAERAGVPVERLRDLLAVLGSPSQSWLRRPKSPVGRDPAEIRDLATDVLAQVIDDGRLTSRELTEALTDRST